MELMIVTKMLSVCQHRIRLMSANAPIANGEMMKLLQEVLEQNPIPVFGLHHLTNGSQCIRLRFGFNILLVVFFVF